MVILQQAIAYLFQVHSPTPLKRAWVSLTFANAVMILALAIRRGPLAFRLFMAASAITIIQKSPLWGAWGEWSLLIVNGLFVGWLTRLFPGSWYRFLLACGFLGVLVWVVPQSRSDYPRTLFHTRLLSSMACFAMILGALTWEWKRPPLNMLIAALWFVPPMIASASVNWDVSWWTVQVVNTGIWTACLVGWTMVVAPESPAVRE